MRKENLERSPLLEKTHYSDFKIKPKRAVEVLIKIGGDTQADVRSAIEQILYSFDEPQGVRNICSGSPHCGWYTEAEFNPDMTHEMYIKELNAYIESRNDG